MQELEVTPAAHDMITRLQGEHGKLLFLISGGCCDGSAPLCFSADDFKLGAHDVLLGQVGETPVYVSDALSDYFTDDYAFCLDIEKGRGGGFSLEAPYGVRFINRGSVCALQE